MKMIWQLVILILILGLAACSSDDDNPVDPKNSQVLVPLALGNYWIYSVAIVQDGQPDHHTSDTVRVIGKKTFPDGTMWCDLGIGDATSGTVWFANTQCGYEYRRESRRILYPYPFPIGRHTFSEENLLEQITIDIFATDDVVTVAAGTFVCYHYRTADSGIATYDTWCSPGVGRIKEITAWNDSTHRVETSELLEYHLE